VQAYLANGHNATQAAIAAGYSKKAAQVQGSRMLSNAIVRTLLAKEARAVSTIVNLETERTLNEIACISYFDPAELYDDDGKLIPIRQLPRHVRAAIASIEHDKDTGRVIKIKLWDKNAAIEKAMKHHGLYEKDNTQKREELNLQIVFVDPPSGRVIEGEKR